MARPTTREEFKAYCLRRLGAPVIQINVDDEQVEDRVDDAINYWWDYHFDGSEILFYEHEISQQDIDDGYITLPDIVTSVVEVFKPDTLISNSLWHGAVYQTVYQELMSPMTFDMASHTFALMRLEQIQNMLTKDALIRFNKATNKLYLDYSWELLPVGKKILIRTRQNVDPSVYPDIWKDRWLQEYATALIKYQWGMNLIKYEGLQLPGGQTMNGRQLYDDAITEIEKMEAEFKELNPLYDIIG